jgi:hypothetical protein
MGSNVLFLVPTALFLRDARVGEQMIAACVVPTVKHGGGGVMVWGCFAGDSEFKAHLFSMATTAFYSDSPSHLDCAYRDNFLFFNRTMTQHTSRLCKDYLTKKDSDGVLRQITWPPELPDLHRNYIVWDELDSRVNETQPTSVQHMWELLQECWKNIPGEAG